MSINTKTLNDVAKNLFATVYSFEIRETSRQKHTVSNTVFICLQHTLFCLSRFFLLLKTLDIQITSKTCKSTKGML
jgi:hypothetical protein